MTYRIAKNPTFTARVNVFTPNEKCGHDKTTFIARFKRVAMDDIESLKHLPHKEVLEQVLVGWDDLLDEEGRAVEFSDATKWAILQDAAAFIGLRDAFWENALKGKEKN